MSDVAINALVVIVVNAIGYAAVWRELKRTRQQHKTVVEDHEHRITMLEKRHA